MHNRKTSSLTNLVFIVIFLLALASGTQMLSLDSDLGRHIALGNIIIDQRFVPTRDLLSHTLANAHRPPYEWLAQLLFAMSHRWLGLDGVILLTSAVIGATFALVYQQALRRSGSPIIAFLLVFLAAGASSLHWLPRPHIFTFLILAVWLDKLERVSSNNPPHLLVFPLIMLLWANIHGGFIFGVLACVAYVAGWLWDTLRGTINKLYGTNLLKICLTSLLASILTPDLWHNWEAVLNNRSSYILNKTIETLRPDLITQSVLPFTAMLFVTILLFFLHFRSARTHHIILLSGLGFLSILMSRNIPLFAIASTPILADMISRTLSPFSIWVRFEQRFKTFGSINWNLQYLLVSVLLAAGLFSYLQQNNNGRTIYQFNARVFPVRAVDFIQSNPQSGNMLNDFNWGGYLLYRLYPQYLVYVDSQTDFYGESFIREYDLLIGAQEGWQNILNKYNIRWAILSAHSPLGLHLQKELGWSILRQDSTAIILRAP